jgi:ABC-type transporter Mla MlaB component
VQDSIVQLKLSGAFCGGSEGHLRTKFKLAVAQCSDIRIDLSKTECMDAEALGLLLLLSAHQLEIGCRVDLDFASAALKRNFRFYGVNNLFESADLWESHQKDVDS